MGNTVVVLDGIFDIVVMSCFSVVLITSRAQYLDVDVKTRIGPTNRSVAAVEPHNVSTIDMDVAQNWHNVCCIG